MKNSSKLLTLSAALLLSLGVVACGTNNPTSNGNNNDSTVEPAKDTALEDAAGTLWEILKKYNDASVTASFDVNKVLAVFSNDEQVKINVSWKLEIVEGDAKYASLQDKNDTFQTVNINFGPTNSVATKVKLTPTLTYNGETKGLGDILGDATRNSVTFTVPAFAVSTHEDWVAAGSDKTKQLTFIAKVVDIIDPTGSSSSKGSMYVVTSEGYGYYAYKPTAPADGTYAKVGDIILLNGTRSDYSGQEEFAAGCTYSILEGASDVAWNYKDASAAWAAAKSSKVADIGSDYQNTPVELKDCVPTRVDGSYYYFKVGSSDVEFNVYDNNYFLSTEQRNAFKAVYEECMAQGKKFDVKGIATVYSNVYQIYLTASTPDAERIVAKAGMSDSEKEANVRTIYASAVKASYDAETTIKVDLPAYVQDVTYNVTEGDTISVVDGELKVTPKAADVVNKVTATVKLSETYSFNIELTIATEDNSVIKYVTANADYNTFAANSTETTLKAVSKKNILDSVDVTVSHSAIIDASNYKEFNIGKSGGFIKFAAPEGYKIGSVAVEYYNYINMKAYAGTDNSGTELAGVAGTAVNASNKGKLMVYTVDGDNFYLDNPSTYDQSLFYISITLTKADTGEDPVVVKEGINTSIIPAIGALDAGATYLSADAEFEYLGAKWVATSGSIGRPTAKNQPTYNQMGLFQVKKGVTGFVSKEAISGVTKITITWYATYDSEDTNYFPLVKVGDTADAAKVAVACDQTEKLNGEETGLKDGTTNDRAIYKYVNTYTLDGSAKFFEISANGGALYIDTIVLEKGEVTPVDPVEPAREVTNAKVVDKDGKATLVLEGTYQGYTKAEIEALKPAMDLQENANAGGGSSWARPIILKDGAGATIVANDNGTFSVSYDISSVSKKNDTYMVHFSLEGALQADGNVVDYKPSYDLDNDPVVIDNTQYTVKCTKDGSLSWGLITIYTKDISAPVIETTNAELVVENDKAYLVISGTYENYTEAQILAMNAGFDLQENGYNGGAWNGTWGYAMDTAKPVITAKDGAWTAKYELVGLNDKPYTVHFSLEGKINESGDNVGHVVDCKINKAMNQEITVGGKTYKLTNVPGSSDPAEFWGNMGITVTTVAPVDPEPVVTPSVTLNKEETVRFEVENATPTNWKNSGFDTGVFKVENEGASGNAFVAASTGNEANAGTFSFNIVVPEDGKVVLTAAYSQADNKKGNTMAMDKIYNISVDGVDFVMTSENKSLSSIASAYDWRTFTYEANLTAGEHVVTVSVKSGVSQLNTGTPCIDYFDFAYGKEVVKTPDITLSKEESVKFEAENATPTNWKNSGFGGDATFVAEDTSASGGKFVTASTGDTAKSGSFSYNIEVPEDGKVYLTVAYSQGENKKTADIPMDRTYKIMCDDVEFVMTSENKTLEKIDSVYNWRTFVYEANLTAGVHTITVTVKENTGVGTACIDSFEFSYTEPKPVKTVSDAPINPTLTPSMFGDGSYVLSVENPVDGATYDVYVSDGMINGYEAGFRNIQLGQTISLADAPKDTRLVVEVVAHEPDLDPSESAYSTLFIEAPVVLELEVGNNTVDKIDTDYTFTAPQAGTYIFSSESDDYTVGYNYGWYEGSDLLKVNMTEGQTITVQFGSVNWNDEISYVVNIALDDAGGEAPVTTNTLEVGDNTIDQIAEYTFTAPAAGTYSFTSTDPDFCMVTPEADSLSSESPIYTKTMAEGDKITLSFDSWNWNSSINYVVKVALVEDAPATNVLKLGDTKIDYTNGTGEGTAYTFTAPEDGTYELTCVLADFIAIVETDEGAETYTAASDENYKVTLKAGETVTINFASNTNKDTGSYKVAMMKVATPSTGEEGGDEGGETPVGNTLSVGTTSISIDPNYVMDYDHNVYTFTAAEAGTYEITISSAEGMYKVNGTLASTEKTSVTLEAGESVSIAICSWGTSANVIIAKA